MASVNTNQMFTGKGRGLIIASSVAYPIEDISELSLMPNVKSTSWESSDTHDTNTMMTGRDFKIKMAFKGISPDLLYLFLGGTKTAGANSRMSVIGESSAVAAGVVTASNTPIVSPLTLVVYTKTAGVKTFFEKVDANPTGNQYVVSSTTITVNTSHNGTPLYRDYDCNGSADATTIAFDPTSVLAPSVELYATMKWVDKNNTVKYFNIDAKDCQCISVSPLPGTNDGNLKDVEVELDVRIGAANDLVLTGEIS